MGLPYPTKVVLPFDIATAQDMNERHANDVALASGSGLDDEAVTTAKIDDAAVTPVKRSGGFAVGTLNANSATVTINTLDFTPKEIEFRLYDTKTSASGAGWGIYNVAQNQNYGQAFLVANGAVAEGNVFSNTYSVVMSSSSNTFLVEGAVTSVTSTGFTVTFATQSDVDFIWIARA